MNTARHKTAINVPNILTLVRLLLTPLFVILLLRDQLTMALLVFTLAGISDGLDGLIARWLDQRTVLGAYLDPLADKVLLVSAYVCLAILGIIPDWLAVIVLSRDIMIVTGIALLRLTDKRYKIRPSFVSKCTTVAQILMVIVSLMMPAIAGLDMLRQLLLWATAGLTTISGLSYIYTGMNLLQPSEKTDSHFP